MFSGIELRAIRGWARSRSSEITSHITGEYAIGKSIEAEVDSILDKYVSLDADHIIHLLDVCTKYKDYVNSLCYEGSMSSDEGAAESYQVGYMQGRLEIGWITAEDLNVLYEWENLLR